jgi:class 3 adenylate cyclase/putative methionine-R-sulfoxide reductase with GAF domain
MKRRSKAGSKPIKRRRRKTPEPKRRNAPKAAARSNSSSTGERTEIARLGRELREALEQQTATSDVLRIISNSPTEIEPVLDAIVRTAGELCASEYAMLFRLRDGKYHVASSNNAAGEYLKHFLEHPITVDRGSLIGRTDLERRPVHIVDCLADPEYKMLEAARLGKHRTMLGVPLLRDGVPIGALGLLRTSVKPFTEKQIELVTTFANEAVIAIENTRLLSELRQSLEQQTATAEVLGVISRSRFELQPVLQSVVETATLLCRANTSGIYRLEGGRYHLAAVSGHHIEAYLENERQTPISPGPGTLVGRAAMSRQVVQIEDAWSDPLYEDKENIKLAGVRSMIGVPLMRGDEAIGVIALARTQVGPFVEREVELVRTFADQAVIAIENARLLKELRERTDQLETQSLELEKLNQLLEQRVADQVGEIERMGRLRRFLPPQVADLIVASGTEKQLESHRREITALFCDLRGFTGFTESADAEDVMALLRDYHAAIGEKINEYSGTLERYAGDGVMVVFNDPVPVDNPALKAVLMALEMREVIGALTEKWRRLGHDIGFGIGIAHGFATLGTIGFEGRFDHAAIGTVSNVASRLCDEAKPGQILISPRVLMAVEGAVSVEPVGEFALKGIRRPLAAHNVLAAKPQTSSRAR